MPHDPLTSIEHMLNHARQARELAAGRCRADLDTDPTFTMLLTHLMEIFGEASSRVPEEFRNRHQEFNWQAAADFRNVLIHQFDVIDYDILWRAIQDELPPLIRRLEVVVQPEA